MILAGVSLKNVIHDRKLTLAPFISPLISLMTPLCSLWGR
jgi:hypothetical protein